VGPEESCYTVCGPDTDLAMSIGIDPSLDGKHCYCFVVDEPTTTTTTTTAKPTDTTPGDEPNRSRMTGLTFQSVMVWFVALMMLN